MPTWILLDVNGTLTDPAALGTPWGRPELGERILATAVETATVVSLFERAPSAFTEHLAAAVATVAADAGIDPARAEAVLTAARALPARPGAAEALGRLRNAGVRLAALTNSGADAGQRTLEANGLIEHVERVLGVDAVGRFKPHPAVYAYALAELDVPASEVTLIATHPWDLAGAANAGIGTGWVRHGVRGWPAVYPTPDRQADGLLELANSLI